MTTPTCPGSTSVRLTTPGAPNYLNCDISVPLTEGTMQRFVLPENYKLTGSDVFNKTVLVDSTCPIDVAAYNVDRFSNDAFLVLPTSKLGQCNTV